MQFLWKVWPNQLAFLHFIVCRIFISSLLFVIVHFSHDRSNWSPSFSSTTFQIFPSILDQLSGVANSQHQTELYSKCSTLLVSSLNLTPFCRRKRVFFRWQLLLPWKFWISFSAYVLRHLLWCYANSWKILGMITLGVYLYLSFFHIRFHSIASSNLT